MSTILVVDDEEPICQLVQRVLERRGHRVVACQAAGEALAVTEPFDLLLVDLALPEMSGPRLAEKLRERRPKLPVVVMSGYLPGEALPPPASFMQKPMVPSTIVAEVERLLQG